MTRRLGPICAALATALLLSRAAPASSQEAAPASPSTQEFPAGLLHRHPLLPSIGGEPAAPAPAPEAVAAPQAVREFPARDVDAALLQYFTLLVSENLRYWGENGFPEDWQFKLTWEDQRRRLLEGEGYRFDSNAFATNWTHSYAGGVYYTLGRANGLTTLESLALVLGESLYWEGVVEWREVLSLNDMATTIFGGVSIGEPWYQLGAYLNSRDGRVPRAIGFVHPVMGIQTVMGKRWPNAFGSAGMPGYGVSLLAGAIDVDSPERSVHGTGMLLGLRSRLADPRLFTAPGESRGWVTDTVSAELSLGLAMDGGKVRETEFFSRAVLLGKVDRRLDDSGRGRVLSFGLGSAFTLRRLAPVANYDGTSVPAGDLEGIRLEEPREFRDKCALVHLAGPVVEGVLRGRRGALSFLAELYPDFGLVNAYALNDYSAGHPIEGMKTTALYYGYYYGVGASLRGRVDATVGPFSAGIAAEVHRHSSVEGLDRFQDDLTADIHARDAWDRLRASVGVAIPRSTLRLEGTAEWSRRKGWMGDTTETAFESRYAVAVLIPL